MYYTTINHSICCTSQSNIDVINVTYVFKRWLKSLHHNGQLKSTSLNEDYITISNVIKGSNVGRTIKSAIVKCRDYALAETKSTDKFAESLTYAIEMLCDSLEDNVVRKLKNNYADQGMTERYRPLSKRLAHEKIRKIGKTIAYTDATTDNAATTKLVRRIVEKRAAQTVYRNSKRDVHVSNRYRQSVRRVTSFSLFYSAFTDYDQRKRMNGTHWRVTFGKFGKMLKSKKSYNTYEEAFEACGLYAVNHPCNHRPMNAYKCEHCGKWHIGHERNVHSDGENILWAE